LAIPFGFDAIRMGESDNKHGQHGISKDVIILNSGRSSSVCSAAKQTGALVIVL